MKRYFGKIEEWDKFIYWEWDKNTNDTLINLLPTINHSKHCMSVSGNLFIVLDSIKANTFKVIFLSKSPDGMEYYFNFDEFTATDAYYWAKFIGNRDIMIDKITNSEDAYYWAKIYW